MARNLYFSEKVLSEQNLYEDIIIESLKIYGQDVYYLPRDIVAEDKIFGDDIPSSFNSSYKIEMYIENVDGFDGEGDLFTKFGIEIRDQATFVVSRRRWRESVARLDNEINSVRPREGDLIYLPLSNKIFQVMMVEHEQPFYQINNLPTFKLRCELFEYSGEDFDTNIGEVDDLEYEEGYNQILSFDSAGTGTLIVGNTLTQTLSSGVIVSGDVTYWNDSDLIAQITHVGATDGNFHLFTLGTASFTDSASIVHNISITALDEQLNTPVAQNKTFNDEDDFIDFTERNPFGDPL